ncbi:MAG: hypothetical protein PHG65_04715 [Kiritimatiellae bacterium]|nr:hypothetical protein [Kiritimatiellia bacterium]
MNNTPQQCGQILAASGEEALVSFLAERFGQNPGFCVEFGAKGHGPTWALRHVLMWNALLMDMAGDSDPTITKAAVTAENIHALFAEHGVPSEFDFLAIDIDGNDYWVWKALDEKRFSPRMVCIEYNCFFAPDVSVTLPYDLNRTYGKTRYYGASAAALYNLAQAKGYSLVCVEWFMNLFFVRNDLLAPEEQNLPLERLFQHPVDVELIAQQQGFNWRPSWINASPPDLEMEKWVRV